MITVYGSSLAALRVCAEVKERSPATRISVVTDDPYPPYDRPPLSKHLFGDFLRPLSATGLGNLAELADSVTIEHLSDFPEPTDHPIVLALGSQPRRTIPGARVLRTRDDAQELRRVIQDAVTIVGAGWIGCELAASCAARGVEVTLLEAAPTILPALSPAAPTIAAHLTDLGVVVKTGIDPTTIATHLDGVSVVVEATGSEPTFGGVDVDEHGRVTAGVYALGDMARWPGVPGGHWKMAIDQAPIVAETIEADLAGREPEPPPPLVPEVDSTIGDLELLMIGRPAGTPVVTTNDTSLRCLWIDDTLTGGLVINRPADAAGIRKFLGAPLDVDTAGEDILVKKMFR